MNCRLCRTLPVSILILSWGAHGFSHNYFPAQSQLVQYAGPSGDNDGDQPQSLFKRFSEPLVDDKGLVLADTLMSGAVAPSLITLVVAVAPIPYPSWLYSATVIGNYVQPTLEHGTALALCWLFGAVAGRAFEAPNFATGTRTEAFLSTLRSGAFAAGILIFATQAKLLFLGIPVAYDFGTDPRMDALVTSTLSELTVDILVEAFVMLSWRNARWSAFQDGLG